MIATADHSHVFTIAGNPSRGNPILGLVQYNGRLAMGEDGKPYTTLGYSNGPWAIGPGPREDLTGWDTEDPTFRQQSTVKLRTETHGGEDVGKEVTNVDQYLKRSSVMSLLKK